MQYRYTKTLNKKIKKLNLNYKDTGGLLVCLYLYGGCSEEDCAKLFEFTLDSIIDYLKYEQIYGYKICSKCEKLKERNDIEFKRRKGTKNTIICTKCTEFKYKKYYQKTKGDRKLYYLNNRNKKLKYMKKYNKDNREDRIKYINKYNKNNKEKIKKIQKNYYQKNKEIRNKYIKVYYNRSASEELLQRLETYEEISGNQIKCKYCGDWYIPTNMEVHNRLQGISNNDINYIYCSQKCKEACPVFNKRLYPKGFKSASSREVNPVLRQLVFERDQYTCQKCFIYRDELNCPLHCHHINPYVNSPIEGNDPENCITLCKDCHKEVHEIPGCGYAELRCG